MSSGNLLLIGDSAAVIVMEADASSGRAGGVRKCGVRHGGREGEREGEKAVVSWDL